MRKSGLTGDEAYVLSKHGKATEDLGPLKKEIGLLKEDIDNLNDKKITKFYASNLGETHITDSDDGKIADMMVYGKSEQKSTMGKNLLKLSEANAQGNANGLSATMNADGSISVTGASTSTWSNIIKINNECHTDNATYTFSVDKNSGIIIGLKLGQTKLDDANYQTHRIMQNQLSCTFETGGSNEYCSLFLEGLTVGKWYNFTIYPMLEKGSEAHAYEPYTGGQPSPSPDYPQEIKSVVNPTVKVCGKNLLDCRSALSKTIGGLSFINNKDGSFSISGKNTWTYSAYDIEFMVYQSGTYKAYRGTNSPIPLVIIYDPEARENVAVITDSGETFQLKKGKLYYYSIAFTDVNLDIDVTYKPFLTLDVKGTYADYEPYTEQSITLPHTLNAIPVASDGNVTIDGQQYVADYVDVERGKLVKMVDSSKLDNTQSIVNKTEWLLVEPQEIDLTQKEVQTLKTLVTYYPTTNIFINSEQLDGYTVFNYPISLANGWNYVKQQLNDNRDYIYDMDLQSAEAYVNSEYAVVLTELEV